MIKNIKLFSFIERRGYFADYTTKEVYCIFFILFLTNLVSACKCPDLHHKVPPAEKDLICCVRCDVSRSIFFSEWKGWTLMAFLLLNWCQIVKDTDSHPRVNRIVNTTLSAVSKGQKMKFGSFPYRALLFAYSKNSFNEQKDDLTLELF